jgi:hypothetical protein
MALGGGSKHREINGFRVACDRLKADVGVAGRGRLRDRKLWVHRPRPDKEVNPTTCRDIFSIPGSATN